MASREGRRAIVDNLRNAGAVDLEVGGRGEIIKHREGRLIPGQVFAPADPLHPLDGGGGQPEKGKGAMKTNSTKRTIRPSKLTLEDVYRACQEFLPTCREIMRIVIRVEGQNIRKRYPPFFTDSPFTPLQELYGQLLWTGSIILRAIYDLGLWQMGMDCDRPLPKSEDIRKADSAHNKDELRRYMKQICDRWNSFSIGVGISDIVQDCGIPLAEMFYHHPLANNKRLMNLLYVRVSMDIETVQACIAEHRGGYSKGAAGTIINVQSKRLLDPMDLEEKAKEYLAAATDAGQRVGVRELAKRLECGKTRAGELRAWEAYAKARKRHCKPREISGVDISRYPDDVDIHTPAKRTAAKSVRVRGERME